MIPLRDDQPSSSKPYVTYFLITLNLLIFLFEWVLNPEILLGVFYQFGLVPSHISRMLTAKHAFNPVALSLPFFTSMFLHGSWMHVIGNMWFLWIFGDNVEDYLGHFKYLVYYLLCGIAAAFSQILFTPHLNAPTVGASGAIAGIMGGYFILYARARVLTWLPPIFFFYLPAWAMLGYWFVLQFLYGAASSITYSSETRGGGIAFWAHVGGFVAGVVLIKIFPRRTQPRRYATW